MPLPSYLVPLYLLLNICRKFVSCNFELTLSLRDFYYHWNHTHILCALVPIAEKLKCFILWHSQWMTLKNKRRKSILFIFMNKFDPAVKTLTAIGILIIWMEISNMYECFCDRKLIVNEYIESLCFFPFFFRQNLSNIHWI